MSDIQVAIVGGSGYVGGELLRLLLAHPYVEVAQITSESSAGKPVTRAHPNLRKRTALKFVSFDELVPCDTLFLCLPHGEAMHRIEHFQSLAPRIIDLSADFRLRSGRSYQQWYGESHAAADWLDRFVYGIPELHREEMKSAAYVSSAGCNATATILALYPLYKHGLVDEQAPVVEVKTGSSEGGAAVNAGSHHPERSGAVRSYSPTGHRHSAEIEQELTRALGKPVRVHFSATAIERVRGVLATCHIFFDRNVSLKEVWSAYRNQYSEEPFIRLVAEKHGFYRYPEPKLLSGTNYCDVGFELDSNGERLVVMSAIDNLMKGAAGQAVQAFNIMHRLEETTGLEFAGLHPL